MRHGESRDNHTCTLSGWRDVPLTPAGVDTVRRIAFDVARLGIREIVCSDLTRARDTATTIQRALSLPPPSLWQSLRERSWGEWEGQPRRELSAGEFSQGAPGGESLEALRKRVRNATDSLPPACLVVTHAGWIRCWLEMQGRATDEVPEPGGWLLDHEGVVETPATLRATGTVFTAGAFEGRVQYVASPSDLQALDSNAIALLAGCSKSDAIEAMDRAGACLNVMRALTAHLSFGRISAIPYAVVDQWTCGVPPEGAWLRVHIDPKPIRRTTAPFPDQKPAKSRCPAGWGGKAAGLKLLQEKGFHVPEFHVLSIGQLRRWGKGDALLCNIERWTHANLEPRVRWAVRSSADVEDSERDPMSGSFESVLHLKRADIPKAAQQVIQAAGNAEIQRRIRKGLLNTPPRMALIIQKMVQRPLLAGTVFIPSPDDVGSGVIESVSDGVGDALMDGRAAPEYSARIRADGSVCEWNRDRDADLPLPIQKALQQIGKEAVCIYKETGRGDLEFAVDRKGGIHWLQARLLPVVVEIVDRRGFSEVSSQYYRQLAFAVHRVNATPPVYFRVVDLPDGRFGYTVGIRSRDRLFHDAIASDPTHLNKVTRIGWRSDQRLAGLLDRPTRCDCDVLFRELVFHGAVQLPFSMPVNPQLMDRYNSESMDGGAGGALLDEFLGVLVEKGLAPDPVELFQQLYQPRTFVSTLSADRILLRMLKQFPEFRLADYRRYVAHDLRDLPDVSQEGKQAFRENAMQHLSAYLAKDPDLNALAQRIQDRSRQLVASRQRRKAFRSLAATRLSKDHVLQLQCWMDYLEMKAETNETHSLYRGLAFTLFAKTGYSPRT
jgi:broad specificity phosphatase PhoE